VNADLPVMPLSTILKSTNNFSDKLGEGGFGTVYKVMNQDNIQYPLWYLFCMISPLAKFLYRDLKNVLGCFNRWKGNCCKAFKNFSSRCGGIQEWSYADCQIAASEPCETVGFAALSKMKSFLSINTCQIKHLSMNDTSIPLVIKQKCVLSSGLCQVWNDT
jgi:hypothetical protein